MIVELGYRRWCFTTCVVDAYLQAPIPGIVLSYRLSRSLRGWHPGHHGLPGSASDGSLSQQVQQLQPDSEYGAIAKFAGTTVYAENVIIIIIIYNNNRP